MFKIQFQLNPELTLGEVAYVNIDNIMLNEGVPLPRTTNGSITGSAGKVLNLTAFLQGLYIGPGTMMQANDEFGPHFAPPTADQITVELHNAANYGTIVYSAPAVNLSTSGIASTIVPIAYNGSYYITIRHRNSIETTSANPVSFAGGSISYNFSTVASQAYGSNQMGIGGTFMIYSGDVNQDGFVDTGDITPIDNDAANFAAGYLVTDVNGDGIADTADMTIVDNNAAAYVGAVTP
jgi:hypothetical protein